MSNLSILQNDLSELSTLEVGWDSYDAEPPNQIAIDWCRVALDYLTSINQLPDRILPSVENGCAIIWRRPGIYADIEFFNTGEIAGITARDGHEPFAFDIKPDRDELIEAINSINFLLLVVAL